jgi:hypothetical protein
MAYTKPFDIGFTCPIRGRTEQELMRQLPRPQPNLLKALQSHTTRQQLFTTLTKAKFEINYNVA